MKFGRTGDGLTRAPTAILLGVAAGVALFGALIAFIKLLMTVETPELRGPLVAMFGAVVFFLAFSAGALVELWRVIRHADQERAECDRTIETLQRQLDARGADLESAMKEAERATRARTIFLGRMSEALMVPLDRLIEQAGSMTPADPMQAVALTQIILHSETLHNEIHLLLDTARIESGQLNLFIERDINLAELLNPVIEAARHDLLVNPNVKLNTRIADNLLIDGDRMRLCRIVELLLTNAIKYTEAGTIKLVVRREKNEVVFAVSDTGAPLMSEELPRAFDGLSRAVAGIHAENVDLGLIIVKALALAHKGRVWAENVPDDGVVYKVALPF